MNDILLYIHQTHTQTELYVFAWNGTNYSLTIVSFNQRQLTALDLCWINSINGGVSHT